MLPRGASLACISRPQDQRATLLHRKSREQVYHYHTMDYGGGDVHKVTVEHVLILSVAKSIEEPLRRALKAWGESSKGTLKSLQIFGYAASAYLVMLGASRLIDSMRSKRKIKKGDSE